MFAKGVRLGQSLYRALRRNQPTVTLTLGLVALRARENMCMSFLTADAKLNTCTSPLWLYHHTPFYREV